MLFSVVQTSRENKITFKVKVTQSSFHDSLERGEQIEELTFCKIYIRATKGMERMGEHQEMQSKCGICCHASCCSARNYDEGKAGHSVGTTFQCQRHSSESCIRVKQGILLTLPLACFLMVKGRNTGKNSTTRYKQWGQQSAVPHVRFQTLWHTALLIQK